jgi:hypothetical protein
MSQNFLEHKKRAHLFSSYRLNLQALMTLMAFSSSRLRLSFIFLSLASLMISLSSVLALPFWSSLFYFCLGLGFCQPYHHLPWPMLSSSISAKNAHTSIPFFPPSDVVYTNLHCVRVRSNYHTEEPRVHNSGTRRRCRACSFQFVAPHYQVCSFYKFRFSYFTPFEFYNR